MNMIEQIKADREGMDGASWKQATGPALNGNYHTVISGGDMICECWDGEELIDAANAKRIARVPDMEAALIAADELANSIQAEFETIGCSALLYSEMMKFKAAIGDTK